jgi:hypothetical protein
MAWKKKQGMSREQAMMAYIDQVDLIDEELSTGGAALVDATGGNAAIYSSQGLGANGGDLYSSWEGAVAREGILYKQRDVFKGWRPRFFHLKVRFGGVRMSRRTIDTALALLFGAIIWSSLPTPHTHHTTSHRRTSSCSTT